MTEKSVVKSGPCCFCAAQIDEDAIKPCRIETSEQEWQNQARENYRADGLFDPAHF